MESRNIHQSRSSSQISHTNSTSFIYINGLIETKEITGKLGEHTLSSVEFFKDTVPPFSVFNADKSDECRIFLRHFMYASKLSDLIAPIINGLSDDTIKTLYSLIGKKTSPLSIHRNYLRISFEKKLNKEDNTQTFTAKELRPLIEELSLVSTVIASSFPNPAKSLLEALHAAQCGKNEEDQKWIEDALKMTKNPKKYYAAALPEIPKNARDVKKELSTLWNKCKGAKKQDSKQDSKEFYIAYFGVEEAKAKETIFDELECEESEIEKTEEQKQITLDADNLALQWEQAVESKNRPLQKEIERLLVDAEQIDKKFPADHLKQIVSRLHLEEYKSLQAELALKGVTIRENLGPRVKSYYEILFTEKIPTKGQIASLQKLYVFVKKNAQEFLFLFDALQSFESQFIALEYENLKQELEEKGVFINFFIKKHDDPKVQEKIYYVIQFNNEDPTSEQIISIQNLHALVNENSGKFPPSLLEELELQLSQYYSTKELNLKEIEDIRFHLQGKMDNIDLDKIFNNLRDFLNRMEEMKVPLHTETSAHLIFCLLAIIGRLQYQPQNNPSHQHMMQFLLTACLKLAKFGVSTRHKDKLLMESVRWDKEFYLEERNPDSWSFKVHFHKLAAETIPELFIHHPSTLAKLFMHLDHPYFLSAFEKALNMLPDMDGKLDKKSQEYLDTFTFHVFTYAIERYFPKQKTSQEICAPVQHLINLLRNLYCGDIAMFQKHVTYYTLHRGNPEHPDLQKNMNSWEIQFLKEISVRFLQQ